MCTWGVVVYHIVCVCVHVCRMGMHAHRAEEGTGGFTLSFHSWLAPDRVSYCGLHLCWAGWSVSSWVFLCPSTVLVMVLLATPRLHVDPPVPTKPLTRSKIQLFWVRLNACLLTKLPTWPEWVTLHPGTLKLYLPQLLNVVQVLSDSSGQSVLYWKYCSPRSFLLW